MESDGKGCLFVRKVEARVYMVRASEKRRLSSPESLGKRAQKK